MTCFPTDASNTGRMSEYLSLACHCKYHTELNVICRAGETKLVLHEYSLERPLLIEFFSGQWVNWKRSFILMKRIQSLVWHLFLLFFSLLHALYFSNLIFKPEKSSRCWLYFFVLLVRFAGFHYILSMLNYMIIYLLPVNESLIYDSLRSYNGAKKCITCVWYIEFFLLWIKSCLLKMFSL